MQIGLRYKLIALASVTIVTVSVIAGVYLVLNSQIDASSQSAALASDRLDKLTTVKLSAMSLRTSTEAFDSAPSDEAAIAVMRTSAASQALASTLSEMPDLVAAVESLPDSAQSVVSSYRVLGLTQELGLQGALRTSVHGIEDTIAERIDTGLNLDGLMVRMLTLRRSEKDFMLRQDAKYVGDFDRGIPAFDNALSASTMPLGEQEDIRSLLSKYADSFHGYTEGVRRLDEAMRAFEDKVAQATALADRYLAAAEREGAAAQASLINVRAQMSTTFLITFTISAIASLAIAILVSRSISTPIVGMTRAMAKLAHGDLEVDIPARGQPDEIGAMAAAVHVFKQNAIKVQEMNAAEAVRAGQTRERTRAMNDLIEGLTGVVAAAVDGDFGKRIDVALQDDDLRGVATSVNDLVDTVDRGLSETGDVLSALAETNLTHRVRGDFKGSFLKLKDDTNAVGDKLTEIVTQLRDTSRALKTATGEILSGANDLAERTTKQAAAIEETSAAMEQLANTVTENAKRADSASGKARAVAKTAQETGAVMTEANGAMEKITSSSAKISNIIGMIDDIAFQTNLLALNASVEAARAGDAGKGFAVVAVEVRRLAQSAASASAEVKVLIEQSAGEVKGGSLLVADAAAKLISMLDAVQENSTLIDGIAQASQEQSSAIAEVTAAVRQMDEMTQHNAALVEETNAAIEQTEGQASELDRIVDVFVIDASSAPSALRVPAADKPQGARALLEKVKAAASSYLTHGNAALKEGWSEF